MTLDSLFDRAIEDASGDLLRGAIDALRHEVRREREYQHGRRGAALVMAALGIADEATYLAAVPAADRAILECLAGEGLGEVQS